MEDIKLLTDLCLSNKIYQFVSTRVIVVTKYTGLSVPE